MVSWKLVEESQQLPDQANACMCIHMPPVAKGVALVFVVGDVRELWLFLVATVVSLLQLHLQKPRASHVLANKQCNAVQPH